MLNDKQAGMGFSRLSFVLVGICICCTTARAQPTTIAYDGFNYSAGSLAGDNGGTGWSSAWTNDYTAGATFNVSSAGMTYPGLTTLGGSVVWGPGNNGISEDSRTLSALFNSGIVYLQFLSQFGSGSSGGGTPNIRLFDSGTLTGGFGSNGGTDMSILNASLSTGGASTITTHSLTSLNLVVAQINYNTDTTTMWVNPDLSTFDYNNPTSPDATYTGLAPVFNEIALDSRNPADVDEITIMTVPEPGTMFLFVISAIASLLYGRSLSGNRQGTL
ncbi:MAG TPA: hypothetical protein VGN23_16285 [Verrucomicrobiae bacterium]|jgi:hypothetical protein